MLKIYDKILENYELKQNIDLIHNYSPNINKNIVKYYINSKGQIINKEYERWFNFSLSAFSLSENSYKIYTFNIPFYIKYIIDKNNNINLIFPFNFTINDNIEKFFDTGENKSNIETKEVNINDNKFYEKFFEIISKQAKEEDECAENYSYSSKINFKDKKK